MTTLGDATDTAKKAAILGIGALAYRNPKGAARAAWRISGAILGEQIGTIRNIARITKEELLAPEVSAARKRGFPAAGSMWSVSPWIPFTLFGGLLLHPLVELSCTLNPDNRFGACPGSEAVLFDAR